MRHESHEADYLVLVALWVALATVFLALERAVSWTMLFPLTALLWTSAPLIATRLATRFAIRPPARTPVGPYPTRRNLDAGAAGK